MNIEEILTGLREQKDRLDQAISALERTNRSIPMRRGRKPGARRMSADARRRIGLAMKKRWAERKKSAKAA